MSWNILPKNVLQYFLTKLKGLMYTKTEVDSLIPDSLSDLSDDSTHRLVTDTEKTAWSGKSVVSANPQSTTGTLSGLEIDGVGYAVQGGDVSGKYDKITQSGVGSCICDGQSEYFKIATLTITETNINGPIGFEVSQTFNQVTLLQIGFAKTDDTDPAVAWFYTNQRNNYWIVKENTSVWGLYGQFENTVDGCSLHRIVGYRVNNGVTVTVNLTNVSALPSGATQPTYGGSVNYANIANRAVSATDSTKVAKAGDTMTGRLNFTFDTAEINFRQNHASYDGVISYQTAGNEAWLFTTKNAVTSIMFVNGEDTITNIASNRWQSLTPGLQIKNNKVAMGKLIPNGTTPTDSLDVAGNTKLESLNSLPPNTYMGDILSGNSILNVLANTAPAGITLWRTQQADDSPTKGSVSTTMICKHTGTGIYSYVYHFTHDGIIRYAYVGSSIPSSLTWTQIDARNATDSSKEPKLSWTYKSSSGSWNYWKDSGNRYHLHYSSGNTSVNYNSQLGGLYYVSSVYTINLPVTLTAAYSINVSCACSNGLVGATIQSYTASQVKLYLWASQNGSKTIQIFMDIVST